MIIVEPLASDFAYRSRLFLFFCIKSVFQAKPILDELGISTPEEMGYDKPEFHTPSPDWWPKEYYQMYNIRERKIEEIIGPPYWIYQGPAH